jgi:hypothetical protein
MQYISQKTTAGQGKKKKTALAGYINASKIK